MVRKKKYRNLKKLHIVGSDNNKKIQKKLKQRVSSYIYTDKNKVK